MSSCQRECVSHIERVIEFEGPEKYRRHFDGRREWLLGLYQRHPPDYLQKVRALCDKYHILLIADEVMSGFGRTGRWFGVELSWRRSGYHRDSEGITSGYIPFGAVIVSDAIAAHGITTGPLMLGLLIRPIRWVYCCGPETLKVYEEEGLIDNAAAMGKYVDQKVVNWPLCILVSATGEIQVYWVVWNW